MCDAAKSYSSLIHTQCSRGDDYVNAQRQMAEVGCGGSGCVQNKSNNDKKWDWRLIVLGAFVTYKIFSRH
jgi:hypothetical protein